MLFLLVGGRNQVSGSMSLDGGATPSLEDFFIRAAKDVPNLPVAVPTGTSILGSGSDYTVFLDNLGVPSIDFAFNGPYGVYHSVYDSFTWMSTEGDPGFKTFVSCTFARVKIGRQFSLVKRGGLCATSFSCPLAWESDKGQLYLYIYQAKGSVSVAGVDRRPTLGPLNPPLGGCCCAPFQPHQVWRAAG